MICKLYIYEAAISMEEKEARPNPPHTQKRLRHSSFNSGSSWKRFARVLQLSIDVDFRHASMLKSFSF